MGLLELCFEKAVAMNGNISMFPSWACKGSKDDLIGDSWRVPAIPLIAVKTGHRKEISKCQY